MEMILQSKRRSFGNIRPAAAFSRSNNTVTNKDNTAGSVVCHFLQEIALVILALSFVAKQEMKSNSWKCQCETFGSKIAFSVSRYHSEQFLNSLERMSTLLHVVDRKLCRLDQYWNQ